MRKPHHARQAARQRRRASQQRTLKPLYRRPLRYEPLEDRRLLAVVTVTTLTDTVNFNDGLTSLREAVFATNLIGGADTIEFAPALTASGPATILLSQGEILISDSLTITGPGANLLTIDASASDPTPNSNNGDGSRVFQIDDGNANLFSEVSLFGLTLTGGDLGGTFGGGGILSREHLSISHTTIRGNAATTRPGGGIHMRLGNLSIIDSTISGNSSANQGAGIYFRGDMPGAPRTLTVTGSTIAGNSAGAQGGGIFAFGGHVRVTGSTISGNSATEGGGIADSALSTRVAESTLEGNTSSGLGGGLRKTGAGTLEIVGSAVSNNSAATEGGGLSLAGSGARAISNSTLRNNSAGGRGGGIANDSPLAVTASTIRDNLATNAGGGIAVSAGAAVLTNTMLQHNAARYGGGLYTRGATSSVTISGGTIVENSASHSGGGIYNRATVSVSNATIRGNTATVAGGGLAGFNSNTTLFATTISFNAARFGGGLAGASSGNVLTVTNSTVSSNSASDRAAGIYNGTSSSLTLQHSTVSGNVAASTVGGVGQYGPAALVSHSIVANNTHGEGNASDWKGSVALAFSLLGVDAGATITDNGGNLLGTQADPLDPLLGPLANNGGPTFTHALLAGSPAINAGDLSLAAGANGVPQFDQRGTPFGRVFGGRIDIGAFEYQAPSDLNLLVDTLVDESDGNYSRGDLSLREAIKLANQWSSIDTIRFDPALTAGGPATIVLTQGELKITDDVHIIGPGASLLTVDASGNDPTPTLNDANGSRVFNLAGTAATPIDVSVSGLALTGGDAAAGGAISANLVNLTLQHMSIAGNAAREAGGGVYLVSGNLTVVESTISGNGAQGAKNIGGGIAFSNTTPAGTNKRLEIRRSTIANNQAGFNGGGVFAQLVGGSVLVDESHISGNSVTGGGGGGLYLSGRNGTPLTEVTIRRSTVDHNSVGPAGSGGGMRFAAASVTIVDSTITANNGGQSGGGVFFQGPTPIDSLNLTVRNSTISGNTARLTGAGIWVGISRAHVSITNTTIADNAAMELVSPAAMAGGGVYAMVFNGTMTVNGATIRDNFAADSGGIYVRLDSSQLLVEQSQIVGNLARGRLQGSGGGIYIVGQGSATIRDSNVANNSALGDDARGGGIYSASVPLAITGTRIAANTSGRYGGGIYSGAPVEIVGSEIIGNAAIKTKGQGGGIYKVANGVLTLRESQLRGNTATMQGGGVYVETGVSGHRIERSTLAGNAATLDGGALYFKGTAFTIAASTLAGNFAGRDGGGVATANTSSLFVDSSTLSGNTAGGKGGGVAAGGPIEFVNSTISQNVATLVGGGVWAGSNATLAHATVVQNRALQAGGGVYIAAGTTRVRNTIVAANSSPLARDLSRSPVTPLSLRYSLIGSNQGNSLTAAPVGAPDVNGNFIGGPTEATRIDPQLGPLANNGGPTFTHAPLAGSPVINAGDPAAVSGSNGVPANDQRGAPFGRVFDGRLDMGAVEFRPNVPLGAGDVRVVAAPAFALDTAMEDADDDEDLEPAIAIGPWEAAVARGRFAPARRAELTALDAAFAELA